jgi:adenylate cyclase
VLEGSIRRAGNRVRITAQLIDARNGGHLWADRYDRDLTDIFAVQDEVTGQIVTALKVTLTPDEKEMLAAGAPMNTEAHDLLLKARALLLHPTKSRALFEQAVGHLRRVVEISPDVSDAYAALSMAHNLDFHKRWSETPDDSQRLAMEYAKTAVEKDPNNPFAHYVLSIALSFANELELSMKEVEAALALAPNYAPAVNARGVVHLYSGEPAASIPDIEQAMRLDPSFSQQYLHFLGICHFMLGNYETAAAHFRERILLVPETDLTRAFLIATLGHLGQPDAAQEIWRELMKLNPKYTFQNHLARLPFRRAEDHARIAEGLQKAGFSI